MTLRLTTWNCQHGFIEERVAQLHSLTPDLVTLQECRRPLQKSASVLWRGTRARKGIAVVSRNPALRLERLATRAPATVLPVLVHGPSPFLLVALWAHPAPSYEAFALKAVKTCTSGCADLPIVVMGDLNITASAKAMTIMREEFGLVSAYHVHHRVDAGSEIHPTHFWLFRQTAPWHIDFCLVPESWAHRVRDVRVGAFDEWSDSDHRPVTVTIDI